MRQLLWILLVLEAALALCAMKGVLAGNSAVLLLAANSVLLIWALKRGRRKSSCCR